MAQVRYIVDNLDEAVAFYVSKLKREGMNSGTKSRRTIAASISFAKTYPAA